MKSIIGAAMVLLLLQGCSTTTIDEYRASYNPLPVSSQDRVIVLGRRDAGHYETGLDFVECIGKSLERASLEVIPEQDFIDTMYPWFEPRSAPKGLKRLRRLVTDPMVASEIEKMGVRYMIWLDGQTRTEDASGSISCAIGPGGGGCFGFATWDKVSSYEAIVWDVTSLQEKGRVQVDAEGSSYLIGIVAPVPLVARVQGEACSRMGDQLRTFFMEPPEETASAS